MFLLPQSKVLQKEGASSLPSWQSRRSVAQRLGGQAPVAAGHEVGNQQGRGQEWKKSGWALNGQELLYCCHATPDAPAS